MEQGVIAAESSDLYEIVCPLSSCHWQKETNEVQASEMQ